MLLALVDLGRPRCDRLERRVTASLVVARIPVALAGPLRIVTMGFHHVFVTARRIAERLVAIVVATPMGFIPGAAKFIDIST